MTPFTEASAQMATDLKFQAFLDYARSKELRMLLHHVGLLSNDQADPFHIPRDIQRLYFDVAESDGTFPKWSKVLTLIAQVAEEREQFHGRR